MGFFHLQQQQQQQQIQQNRLCIANSFKSEDSNFGTTLRKL